MTDDEIRAAAERLLELLVIEGCRLRPDNAYGVAAGYVVGWLVEVHPTVAADLLVFLTDGDVASTPPAVRAVGGVDGTADVGTPPLAPVIPLFRAD